MRTILVAIAIMTLFAACAKKEQPVAAALPQTAPAQAPAQPAPANITPSPMDTPAQHISGGTADISKIDVARAEGANGHTVAELWAGKAALQDHPVTVRGKVVKFLPGIMGRNWLHLRDGSGSPEQGTHDITVTTNETAAVGDTVLVNGILRADKDFGAGYRYGVIIEEAKLAR